MDINFNSNALLAFIGAEHREELANLVGEDNLVSAMVNGLHFLASRPGLFVVGEIDYEGDLLLILSETGGRLNPDWRRHCEEHLNSLSPVLIRNLTINRIGSTDEDSAEAESMEAQTLIIRLYDMVAQTPAR